MKLEDAIALECGGPGSGPNPGVRWNWKKYGHLVKPGENPRSLSPFEIENRHRYSLQPSADDLAQVKALKIKDPDEKEYVDHFHEALSDDNAPAAKRAFSRMSKETQKRLPSKLHDLMKATKTSKYDDESTDEED